MCDIIYVYIYTKIYLTFWHSIITTTTKKDYLRPQNVISNNYVVVRNIKFVTTCRQKSIVVKN